MYLGEPNTKRGKTEVVEVCLIRVDPEGSFEEQMAYHLGEIKKYQAAIIKEEKNANLYLVKNQMNDVRQANSRKFQYVKKVEEHMEAIEGLQVQK